VVSRGSDGGEVAGSSNFRAAPGELPRSYAQQLSEGVDRGRESGALPSHADRGTLSAGTPPTLGVAPRLASSPTRGSPSDPRVAGDSALGRGGEATVAVVPVRADEGLAPRRGAEVDSRSSNTKTTQLEQQGSTCQLERETPQGGRLGSSSTKEPSTEVQPGRGGTAVLQPGGVEAGVSPAPGESRLSGDGRARFTSSVREPVAEGRERGNTDPPSSRGSLPIEVSETGERVYRCQKVEDEFADLHRELGLSGAALVCRVMIQIAGEWLVACIDTGATFSLLAERVYAKLQGKLSPLHPPQISLSGAGGESLNVKGAVLAEFQFGGGSYLQWLHVGRLQGLDLLLGMDWLTSYGVIVDCASRTIRVGESNIQFGRAMAVNSRDLVRMTKTVRIRPRGVQRVICHIEDPSRAGEQVLVEGTTQLGGDLFVVPSLEVIREDGSLALTLENQSTSFREVEEGMIVAKVTKLPVSGPPGEVNQASGEGESPPALSIWHIPTHVASVNAVGTRHGKEWTSRPLIPEGEVNESTGRGSDCKVYFTEKMVPAPRPSEPTPAEVPRRAARGVVPEYLRCMFPPEGELTPGDRQKLEDLVMEYEGIFVGPDDSPGFTDLITHKIDTGDAKPIKQNYYRRSIKERAYVEAELEKMLANGVIKPSKSPWGAPVVLVRKKSGELRFCIDFRRLNEVTKKDAYPLPKIDECLDALEGSKFFSTLDLASGYWQVAMDPDDAEKTAFVTHRGLFQWTVMPLSLCNAPATFCRLMEMVLADIVWSQCLVYLDDILAFGKDFATAELNLRAVFERLQRANLKLKPKKCTLFASSVEYLGHEVDSRGIRPSRSKVQALHNWATPKNLSEVRTYLGFTGYYRRFVQNYSELAKPLTELTKKGAAFKWTSAQQAAFEEIKDQIEKLPLLYYPKPDVDFHLKVDASLFAIGGALEQEQDGKLVPLGFASKTLCKSRQAYCATKRELYAVVFFMRYFRDITRGTMVIIWTDHAALTWVQDYRQSDNMFIRWVVELSWYKPWKILHVAGKLNEVADSLSRKRESYPEQQELFNKRKPCKLGECPDCVFHKKKLESCRDEDSDDSDEATERGADLTDAARALVLAPPDMRWEFAQRDVDSDDEEPELVDGVDFNLYLTRRLFDIPNRTHLNLSEVEASAQEHGERIFVVKEKVMLRRSSRLAEKRRGAAASRGPAVQGESSDEDEEGGSFADAEFRKPDQTLSQAETQCVRVLAEFGDLEWREVQERDVCLRRVADLKAQWGEEIDEAELKKESPEVQAYCRWWQYIYKNKETGVWMMDKVIQAKGRPVERFQVRLVPVAWRESIWRCVHVHSASHLGYERVYELLRRRFAWPGMTEDIRMMCRACLTCQHSKTGAGGGPAPMKHEYVGFPHERVGIDLQGPLPETPAGNHYICVIQDYFSKRMELYALRQKTAEAVMDALFREYISRHGAMQKLHSDQGTEFDNQLGQELCRMYRIHKTRTTAYAPWSNGMVERSNKTIKAVLRALNAQERDNWDELLPYVFMAYNATPHASTGFTPQRLFYSQCADPLLPIDLMYGCDDRAVPQCHSSYAFHHQNMAMQMAETVREVTGRAVEVQQAQQSRRVKLRHYKVGDQVMLYSPPNARDKLHSQPWTGPHEIIEVANDHNVKIRLLREPTQSSRKAKRGRKPAETTWVNAARIKPAFKAGRDAVLTVQSDSCPENILAVRRVIFSEYWDRIY
jgi:hypothetical protein